jgi:hypothetical protein
MLLSSMFSHSRQDVFELRFHGEVRVRPLTRVPPRSEVFSSVDGRLTLPPPPSRWATPRTGFFGRLAKEPNTSFALNCIKCKHFWLRLFSICAVRRRKKRVFFLA